MGKIQLVGEISGERERQVGGRRQVGEISGDRSGEKRDRIE